MEDQQSKRLGVTTAITTWLNSNGDRVIPEFKVEEYKKNQLKLLTKERYTAATQRNTAAL